MDRVAVLMSTYNGERFLREQLDSILNQKNVDITLRIRDDGSSDGTVAIIEEYRQKHSNIFLDRGENLGVGSSFMRLLYDAGDGFDYYAFSDQDDIWLPDKFARAIEAIGQFREPTLYCSNQMLIDKDKREIGIRYERPINTDYLQPLCINMATGCTMVWNRAMQRLLAEEERRPSKALLRKRIHDVWVAMAASVAGRVYYDNAAYILYRQHENNVVGVRKGSLIKEWRKKLQNEALRNGRSSLAKEILDCFGDRIGYEKVIERLRMCATYQESLKTKMRLCRDEDIMRHSNEGKLMYCAKILMNLF